MLEREYHDFYVCPQTHKPLRVATEAEIQALQKREGFEKIRAAWVRSDHAVAYPVKAGIPLLIPDAAISLRKPRKKPTPKTSHD